MRRRYVGAIAGALSTLQHGCHKHHFGTRQTGRQMFRLDPKLLVGRSSGPGGLTSRWEGLVLLHFGIGSPPSLGIDHCTSSDGFGTSSI